MFLRDVTSAVSAVRAQRTFTVVHAVANAHQSARFAGCHEAGSLSPFDRFVAAVTAISELWSSRSFANAVRRAVGQLDAPDRHASARATTWSTSSSAGSSVEYPSYTGEPAPGGQTGEAGLALGCQDLAARVATVAVGVDPMREEASVVAVVVVLRGRDEVVHRQPGAVWPHSMARSARRSLVVWTTAAASAESPRWGPVCDPHRPTRRRARHRPPTRQTPMRDAVRPSAGTRPRCRPPAAEAGPTPSPATTSASLESGPRGSRRHDSQATPSPSRSRCECVPGVADVEGRDACRLGRAAIRVAGARRQGLWCRSHRLR